MSDIQALPKTKDALHALVEQVLHEARLVGATAAEAAVSCDTGLSVNVRLGEVETLEYHQDQGVGVTVYLGQSKGSASTSDLSPTALQETVAAACRIARYTAKDPYAGLADAALMAYTYPDLDLDHPWSLSAEEAIALARECEDHARSSDARISNSEGASVDSFRGTAVYGNSHGFIGGYTSTRHALSCTVIAQQNEDMQRDYWYSVARQAAGLASAHEIGSKAAQRALSRLGARQLSTRQCPVLFSPEVARSLIGHFIGAVRGGSLYRKASFLLDSLGTQVFPAQVRIHEAPHIPMALGSAPFDGEGVAITARDLVRDGVVQGYVLSAYSARRLNMQTTGNAGGVRNLSIDPTHPDQASLLAEMGTGLLVTELIGQGVNSVTGDYSRGASGFWVENGVIAYPVHEITIAGNLREMFRQLVGIGGDIDPRSNIRTGSLLLERMTLAGE